MFSIFGKKCGKRKVSILKDRMFDIATYHINIIIIIIIFNFISLLLLTPRKIKLNFLLAITMLVTPLGPLDFLSSFPTLPWASLAAYHEVQPPAWPSWEPTDLSGLKPDGPPWVCLALCIYDCLFQGPALPPDCPEKHLIWVDSISTVPLGLQ